MIKVERELGDFEQIEIHTFADEYIKAGNRTRRRKMKRTRYKKRKTSIINAIVSVIGVLGILGLCTALILLHVFIQLISSVV